MLRRRTYPSGGVGRIAVLALTAVIVVALSLVLTCSAMDIPAMQPKLENATVYPGTSGKWDQSFTYTVNCSFSDTVSVTLEVYNLSLHEWTAIGDRTYNGIGEWQSLTWEDVNICSDKCDGTSSYRFKYNGSILLTESGPTIAPTTTPLPPTVQMFKNASVKPAYGRYNDSFTYSVFTQLNQTTNITLEVFDLSSYEWKEAGENQSYTETGNWQLLSWANVTNVSAVDGAGVASYRFFFFDAGERRESEVFYGPELDLYSTSTPTVIYSGGGGGGGGGVSWRRLLEDEKLQKELRETLGLSNISGGGGVVAIEPPKLINATVTPENGSWHESYDYCAVVEHPNRADMWLTLEVYCPGKGVTHIVSNKKISTYNETYLFNWNIVSGNDSNEEFKRALSDNFKIDWMEDANISKSREIINIYTDNHSAEIVMDEKKEKATLKISDGRTYELKVKIENDMLKIYYETNRAKVEWPGVNVFSEEDAEANVTANESPKYYIRYIDGKNDGFLGPFSGPNLTNSPPNLTKSTVIPDGGPYDTQFEYKVHVMDEEGDNLNVTLYILDSEGSEIYNKTHVINGTEAKRGKMVSWRYNKFTEREANKTLKYYVNATDGIVHTNISGDGPHIKPAFPLESISVLFLLVPLIAIGILFLAHERKVKAILKNAGLDFREKRKNLQITDPNISLLGLSWLAVAVALIFTSLMPFTLRIGLISSVILTVILIILGSLLIAWSFGYLPIFQSENPPLRRCYQECRISKRNYYKKLSGVCFVPAVLSILFAFGGYVISAYHGPFNLFGVYISDLHFHFVASFLFAACIFLLLSPILSDWWKWRKEYF